MFHLNGKLGVYWRQGVGESRRSWLEKCKCNQEKNDPLHFSPIYCYHKARDVCIPIKLLKRQCEFIKIVKYYSFPHPYEIVNRTKSGLPSKGADFIMLLALNSEDKTSNLESTWSWCRSVAWIREIIIDPFLYHGFQDCTNAWKSKGKENKAQCPTLIKVEAKPEHLGSNGSILS